jgi:ubiquitin-activating enzyme E1
VVLAGVKAVTIHDTKTVELADLGAQFFLSEASIGKNKAEACRAQLQELNTAVEVSASSAALTEEFLGKFQVGDHATQQTPDAAVPLYCAIFPLLA